MLSDKLDRKLQICESQKICDYVQIKELDSLKEAIDLVKSSISDLKDDESRRLIFRSRAKWAEKGEKSNKYFLNLIKERQKAMVIRKIISNDVASYKQSEISKAIENFYEKLYKKQYNLVSPDNSPLFQDLPKLNPVQREDLGKPISLDELAVTLKTCSESAPGPDGISYKTLSHTWDIMGPLIFDAWTHSCKIGKTSPSQTNSVITLLDKKGKDKTILENLSPISLSNCDIKLCKKALALRTNKVLPDILSSTQTGYVPGRQVNDNSRLINEIINNINSNGEIAHLITLDARKAFDSVDHKYLTKMLELFNFPSEYIHYVKTVYTDLTATVMVNGFTTDIFNIEQSVKHRDALSCALFIIAIEPLLRQIKNNPNIKGVKIHDISSGDTIEVKDLSYADDITALCMNLEGIQHIIDEYIKFSQYSGIKLNVQKTEILVIGKKANEKLAFKVKHEGKDIFIVDSECVTICGITFSNNFEASYERNILQKIIKLERQLNIWRQRHLILQGKILIVKTFGLSQLIYSLQANTIKKEDINRIENIIFRFIWNIKPSNPRCIGKIKRDLLKQDFSICGLRAPDISNIDNAIKVKHVIRCLQNKHPISIIAKNEILKIKLSLNNLVKINKSNNAYINVVTDANNELQKLLISDISIMSHETDGIISNYHGLLQNTKIGEAMFIDKQLRNILNRVASKGIVTLKDLKDEYDNKSHVNIILDCYQLYTKVPIEMKRLLSRSAKSYSNNPEKFNIGFNK